MSQFIPEISGTLRSHIIRIPEVINQVSGIRIFGRKIRSLLFSTDVAIIKNCNADSVIAVYPFTPQPIITHSIIMASDIPVFSGVGGGTTSGKKIVKLAIDAEFQGAIGVVVNAPVQDNIIRLLKRTIDIPVVVSIVSENVDLKERIKAGATIFNVSGAASTPEIVKKIRKELPDFPIIATGGPSEETILRTIEAGANAITYTPPTSAELFKKLMDKYRQTC